MKQFLLLACAVFVLCLSGCGKSGKSTENRISTDRLEQEISEFDEAASSQDVQEQTQETKKAEAELLPLSFPKISRENFPKIDGSTATLPISQALYCLATGADLEEAQRCISHSKTTEAYRSLQLSGGVDRGPSLVIAYAPDQELLSETSDGTEPLLLKPIGRDALVFLTNVQNPVRSLTAAQLVGIYSGKLTNWKDCGGSNMQITAFQRPEQSGSQNLMEQLVMQGTPMAEAPQSQVFGEMGEILDALASYDNAEASLGYSVYYYAKHMYERPQLRFMAVDGVFPSNETIRDGSYPYVSDFYAAIRADEPADSAAHQLFDWLTSEDGQSLLDALGYAALSEQSRSMPEQISDMLQMPQAAGKEQRAEHASETGKLPLAEGEVLIGDGSLFIGEAGTVLFDSAFNQIGFLPGLLTVGTDPLFVQAEESPLVLRNMNAVSDGVAPRQIYRLRGNRLLFQESGTERLDRYGKNGYLVQTGHSFEEISPEDSAAVYRYYDWNGNLQLEGAAETVFPRYYGIPKEQQARFCEQYFPDRTETGGEELPVLTPSQRYAMIFPELLSRYGLSGEEGPEIWYSWNDARPEEYIFKQEGKWYVHDADGQLLAVFDPAKIRQELLECGQIPEEEQMIYGYLQPPYPLSENTALLLSGNSLQKLYVHFYQYGEEVRRAELFPRENGYIVCVGENFYLERTDNYLSVYALDGKLLKRFLGGWLQND